MELQIINVDDKTCEKMFIFAKSISKNSFPKPNKVGVTLLTKKGNFYSGISYHSDIYTLTMHAEATALAHAAIHGERDILAITGPCCHICKQLLWENSIRSGIDILILVKKGSKIEKIPLSSLMQMAWPELKN